MVFVTRQQGLKLQGYFRANTLDHAVIEQSPVNPGCIRITIWQTNQSHFIFELTEEGRKLNVPG